MKVKLFSDLHLEFDKVETPFHAGEGDVLVLAGDICTAVDLTTGGPICDMYEKFFAECVKNYNKVFYTAGNHESYDGVLSETDSILRTIPGVTYLQNEVAHYWGWTFYGATMWADFYGGDMGMMGKALDSMNDFRIIYNESSPINPFTTMNLHKETRKTMTEVIPELSPNVFVFTHHAPSLKSVIDSPRSGELAGAYASDCEDIIRENQNIKVWAHGHIHENQDYMIEQCRVVANPRGYNDYEENKGFNKTFEIDLRN